MKRLYILSLREKKKNATSFLNFFGEKKDTPEKKKNDKVKKQ